MKKHQQATVAFLLIASCALVYACSCSDTGDNNSPGSINFSVIRKGFGSPGEHGERRVTFLATDDTDDACGKYLVYTHDGVAYLVDLQTEEEGILIGSFFKNIGMGRVSLGDDRAAFMAWKWDEAKPKTLIAVIDLNELTGTLLEGAGSRRVPAISKNRIVWEDYRFFTLNVSDNIEIYYKDLSAGERRLTDEPHHQIEPRIYGNHIVWTDERDPSQTDVFMYDIGTSKETNLTNHPAEQWQADVGERGVVWTDLRNGEGDSIGGPFWNTDIYFYDFATGETRRITTDPSDQINPRIYGRYIVWNDLRDGGRESNGYPSGANVYLYDLETGQEKRVTWSKYNDGGGMVVGDKIFWWHSFDGAIYMKKLEEL